MADETTEPVKRWLDDRTYVIDEPTPEPTEQAGREALGVAGLRALLERATPGEWHTGFASSIVSGYLPLDRDVLTAEVDADEDYPQAYIDAKPVDLDLIIAAVNALPDLLAAVADRDRQRDVIEEFRKVVATQDRMRELCISERDQARADRDALQRRLDEAEKARDEALALLRTERGHRGASW